MPLARIVSVIGAEQRLVPGADRLFPGDVAREVEPEEVAVDGDVLEHLGVVARVRHAELVGRRRDEPGRLEEVREPLLLQDVLGGGVGAERDGGEELEDVRLDRRRPEGAGDGDPVVAVDGEVGVAHLVELDGGKAGRPLGEVLHVLPALPEGLGAGEEGPVELAAASERPDDLPERDVPRPPVDDAPELQPVANLLERQEVPRPLADEGQEVLHDGAEPRGVEAAQRGPPFDILPPGRGPEVSMRSLRLFLALPMALAALTCGQQLARPSATPSRSRPGPRRPSGRTTGRAGAVFYEVFVRSFQDSDGDGKGDIEGLISRLDLLNDGKPETTTDLGVDALWLMPVFESPSYHGYDTTDYGMIEPDYGTNADFLRLLDEAHRRGIRVIVDLVVNHSGVGHPWFVSAASSPASPTRDFYVWSPTDPGWKQPWGGNTGTWHQERRRVLLRRLLERDARPELALSRAARRGEADRLPLARAGRRRLPPRRDALPRRDRQRAPAGRHARDARRAEGVRRATSAASSRRRSSSARTGPTRRSSRPTTARRPSRAGTSSRRASTSRSPSGS